MATGTAIPLIHGPASERLRRIATYASVAVAAVLIAAGDATSPVVLHVPGGVLEVDWKPGERATLVGDAVREFERVVA